VLRIDTDPDPAKWRFIIIYTLKVFHFQKFDDHLPSCEGLDPRGSVVFSEATNSFGIRPPPPPVKGQEHARQKFNLHTYPFAALLEQSPFHIECMWQFLTHRRAG
jgi:hypothetical protein